MSESPLEPYRALGSRIKFLREQWQQSLREVSLTLEIDENTLKAIESGNTLPSADLLDMFISHFLLTEDQAQDLRELADNQLEQAGDALTSGIEDMLTKQVVMFMPVDSKVVYTDAMHATVNDSGVVMQFMQNSGPNNQQIPVSRVGMSHDHAKKVIEVLTSTLRQHDEQKKTKLLDTKKDTDNK